MESIRGATAIMRKTQLEASFPCSSTLKRGQSKQIKNALWEYFQADLYLMLISSIAQLHLKQSQLRLDISSKSGTFYIWETTSCHVLHYKLDVPNIQKWVRKLFWNDVNKCRCLKIFSWIWSAKLRTSKKVSMNVDREHIYRWNTLWCCPTYDPTIDSMIPVTLSPIILLSDQI